MVGACARRRWLTTVTSDALTQLGFAEPGSSGGGGAAEAGEDHGVGLAEFRVSQMVLGGGGGAGGAGLPESGLSRG